MNGRNSAFTLVALFALGFAMYFLSDGRNERITSVEPTTALSSSEVDSTHRPEPAARGGKSVPANASEIARPITLLDRYVRSTDLLELVAQLRADADAGDADAARIIAKAYDECFPYAANHKTLDVDLISRNRSEPERSMALAQRATQLQRCAGFISTGVIKVGVARDADATANNLSDLTGQAARLVSDLSLRRADDGPYEMSASEMDLAQKIALSQDAEAIAVLSGTTGLPQDIYAWQLVACDLGRDCGANGYVMRQQCLLVGQCVAGNYREFIRRKALPPDQFEAAQIREREILQAIKAGDVSHLFP